MENLKENAPQPSEKGSSQKGKETNTAHEVKSDDTGKFKRYLRLADQLLSTDKPDPGSGSSAA